MDNFVDIIGYEGYYQIDPISGVVKSLDRMTKIGNLYSNKKNITQLKKGKILNPIISRKGYLILGLSKEGKRKHFPVHRLIGLNFIPNPENKPEINHIDGDKKNNSISNLEWVTSKENSIHAVKTGLRKGMTGERHPSSRLVCNLENGVFYDTIKDAAKAKCMPSNTLRNMLNGVVRNKTKFTYA